MSQTALVNPFFRFDRVGPYEDRALQETPSYLRHAYLSLTLASCVCQVASLSVHVTKLRHKNYKTNKSQEATKFLTTKKSAVEHIKKQQRNTFDSFHYPPDFSLFEQNLPDQTDTLSLLILCVPSLAYRVCHKLD